MRIALLSLTGLSALVFGVVGCSFGSGSNEGNGGGNPRPDASPTVDGGTGIDSPVVEDDDPDRDNVKTPVDNCPSIANPLQANDDGDARGDACDTCPWKANESSYDPDNDHITDDCDPDPRFADQLVYFEGFDKLRADELLPSGWTVVGTTGQWDVSTASGILSGAHASGAAGAALLVHTLPADDSGNRLYVRTAGMFGSGNDKGQAGVSGDLDLSGNAPAAAFCDLTLDAGKTVAGFYRNGASSNEGNTVGNLATPVALRLIVELGGTRRVHCDAKGVNASSATHGDDAQQRAGTAIGLRVISGSAAFRYVAVLRLHSQSQPPAAAAQ
jgi:hypothetical protein